MHMGVHAHHIPVLSLPKASLIRHLELIALSLASLTNWGPLGDSTKPGFGGE